MAGRDQEGFDWMPSGASATLITALMNMLGWFFAPTNQTGGFSLVAGRFGGQALRIAGINAQPLSVKPLLPATGAGHVANITISVGFKYNAGNLIAQIVVGPYDAVAQTFQCAVVFAEFGVVQAWRGDPRSGGVFLGASDAGAFDDQVWEDAECHFVVDNSVGEIEVRFQTESVLHLVNVDTQASGNAYCDSWAFTWTFALGETGYDFELDDLRVYDNAGSHNNTWLGTMRVQGLLTASNGGTLDFTRSNTGIANYLNIANQNADDTLYLFDGTASDYNLSGFQPLVNSAAPIAWVGLSLFQRQDDATQITSKIRISSSGVTHDGAAYFPTQTYSADTEIFETDPNTGLQFAGTAVNALTGGPLIFAIA